MRTCSVENCDCRHYAKGYCAKHYYQFKRHGHILERSIYDANEIIEYDDYAEIVLYDKYGNEAARAIIDLEYIDSVKQYKWHLLSSGYAYSTKLGLLHRYIVNPSEDMVVDHINRNPLDNRRDNLRVCTQHENIFNTSMQCNNTSGVIGVTWDKSRNKWIAQIQINGKNKHLGRYNTKEEAIEARRQAEIEYFGDFAPTRD